MVIREARSSDKLQILKFCQKTFSWGDYIKDVWDYWLNEGNLLIVEKNFPIGLCHGVFLQDHLWIEGIRINSDFRRKGFASNLVAKLESLAIQKKINNSLMLIDRKNLPSLVMAQNLGYQMFQVWNFYSLLPQENNTHEISFGNVIQEDQFPHYVNSWRWLPLNKKSLIFLESKNQIIYSKKDQDPSIAILVESEHFEQTLIVTLFSGSKINTMNIIFFLQNFGFEKKYKRIQILTKEILPELKNLENKISFHLMKKLLS